MRNLGRIILLVVAGLMIGFTIPTIITDINFFTNYGWDTAFTTSEGLMTFISLVACGITILLALPALFAAIRGKVGIWGFIIAVGLGALVVYNFITEANAGHLNDWNVIWNLILGFIYPILYVVGTLFVLIGKK